MDYCDEVMKNERDMSPDPNGESGTTNAVAPDSGRYIYDIHTIIELYYIL